jgi:hypothetical protein
MYACSAKTFKGFNSHALVLNTHPDIANWFFIDITKYRFKIVIIATDKRISISSNV